MNQTLTPTPKAETTNPKDLLGAQKVSISKVSPIALLHCGHAMMDGARKYGSYNWRDKEVQAVIYVDAALRHLEAWFDGEELAQDSGAHHLGHAMACCAILLDAQETGNLIDDRPRNKDGRSVFAEVLARLNAKIKTKAEADRDNNRDKVSGSGTPAVTPVEVAKRYPDPGEGYRLLVEGEVIAAGDQYYSVNNDRWFSSAGDAGNKCGGGYFLPRRRRSNPLDVAVQPSKA